MYCYGYPVKLETIYRISEELGVDNKDESLYYMKDVLKRYGYKVGFLTAKEYKDGFIMTLYEGYKSEEKIKDDDLTMSPSKLGGVLEELEVDRDSIGYFTVDSDS